MTEDIPPVTFDNSLLTHQGDDHPSNLISHTSNSGNKNPRQMISMTSQRRQRSLDTTLRGVFGYTPRRGLASIAKRPGNKYGFRLSSYIHEDDPPEVVRSVLERIRDLQYYETSPIVGMLTRQLKSTMRKEYLARKPKKFLLRCHIGATFKYEDRNKMIKVDTNRDVHVTIGPFTNTPMKIKEGLKMKSVFHAEYHGQLYAGYQLDYRKQKAIIGTLIENAMDLVENEMPFEDVWKAILNKKFDPSYRPIEYWFETPPQVVYEADVSAERFTALQFEGMQRASVLADNFLRHAGGIDIKALEDTDGDCVPTQLMQFFTNPSYTSPMTKIPVEPKSNEFVPITKQSIVQYLDQLGGPYKPKKGYSTQQLSEMCLDLHLNMYALNQDDEVFLRVTQFTGETRPRGNSDYHHPLVFYQKHKHMYLISHPHSIQSIAASCRDTNDHRGLDTTMIVKEDLPIITIDTGESPLDILASKGAGHYIVDKMDLMNDVFQYMTQSSQEPRIKIKDNQIIGFTVSQVRHTKPILPPIEKPKRTAFAKGKKGQPDYDIAIQKWQHSVNQRKREQQFIKSSKVDQSEITHRFSVNPNSISMIPADAVKQICENIGLDFNNQGMGSLALQLAHQHENRPRFPKQFIEELFQEQEGKCANCEKLIQLSWLPPNGGLCCNVDHIKRLSNGGTNKKENLQLLCAGKDSCHAEKTAEERDDGWDRLPEYHSQLAPSMYAILEDFKIWAFVEFTEFFEASVPLHLQDIFLKEGYWQIDFCGDYYNIMRYRKEAWPKFSVMDRPRSFSGELKVGAYYYIATTNTRPFRGCGWYNYNMTKLGLDYHIITLSDIIHEFVPSETLPGDFFVPYLDRIEKSFEGLDLTNEFVTKAGKIWTFGKLKKALLCSFIGSMAPDHRESQWLRTTLSPATAGSWSTDPNCTIVTQPFVQDLDHIIKPDGTEEKLVGPKFPSLFVGNFNKEMAIESTGCFIRWEVIHDSNVLLYKLEKDVLKNGGLPCWLKTDCIGGIGPKPDINNYFWDDDNTVPMLHHEQPEPPKCERMARHIRPCKERLNYLSFQWKMHGDYESEVKIYAEQLVDLKKGFHLNGRAGVGKTTLANAIIAVLEARNMNYAAFSTTHVSKNIMGDAKSQLRANKGANTIDSLYSRFTKKPHIVLKDLKHLDYLLVDEVSMMREKFYAMLCHIKRAIPGLKIILIGDFKQFLAVKDKWLSKGKNPEDSAALFDLCDGHKVVLTKCRRTTEDGLFLFDLCTKLINGESIDITQFPITEETWMNIGYYHTTVNEKNARLMEKATQGLSEREVIRLPALPEKQDPNGYSQDVVLCEGMPVICIKTNEKILKICNGEQYKILCFTDVPDYANMKKKELRLHAKGRVKVGGTVAELKQRLIEASSDLRMQNVRDPEDQVVIPRGEFQKHFRVAYCITYYQSQGCTIEEKYTIYDWDAYHVNTRAQYVALSRATTREDVQIDNSHRQCKIIDIEEDQMEIHEDLIDNSTPQGWIKNEDDEFIQCDYPRLSQRSYGEEFVDEFIRYYDLAKANGSRTLPMRATADKKNPIDKHANEDYDTKCAAMIEDMKNNHAIWVDRVKREKWNLNLLIDDLYVIDLDTPEAVDHFDREIKPKFEEEFATCPLQKTRKGFHYFFVRPEGCTHFNKARAYKDEQGNPVEIDCCTIASTGTRGNINVFPSNNKVWIRSIHEFPPRVMSDRLYKYLDAHYIGLKNKVATKTMGYKRQSEEVILNESTKFWTDYIAKKSGCSTNCVSWSSFTRGRVIAPNRKCLADCNHIAEHDNAFIDILPDGSLKYQCKSARCGKCIVIDKL
jgi:hypothetical protein